MDRALWLLLGLRLRGWFRRLLRNAATLRGGLLLGIGLLFFACVFTQPLLVFFVHDADEPVRGGAVEHVRRVGPLALFAYCLLTVVFSSGEPGITFTPAEVTFLFPAPFNRRQLLAYKIAVAVFACMLSAFVISAALLTYVAGFVAGYVGLLLAFLFLTFFAMAVSLVANTIGARAYNNRRKLVLALLAALLAAVLFHIWRDLFTLSSAAELADRVRAAPVAWVVLAPFSWFVEAFTAENLWPDLVVAAAKASAVDAVLLVVVFALDANYLEASAAASERLYARLQRARSGGAAAMWRTVEGKPRFSLPMLPWWGGVGPTAWRQLTAAVRSVRGMVFFLVIFGVFAVAPALMHMAGAEEHKPAVAYGLASALLGMSLITLPASLTFDFRGDVDRMDVLKALPVAPWRLAVGELLAPVLLLALIQLGVLGVLHLLWGGLETFLLFAAVLSVPANFLSLGIDNLLFLWFPGRLVAVTPGDLQMMGRQMLLMLTKSVVLTVAGSVAAVAGVGAYLAAGASLPAAAVAAFVVLAPFAAVVVPLLALAFRSFDVARDTPP